MWRRYASGPRSWRRGKTPDNPGRGLNWRGGRASEQKNVVQAVGGMAKLGKYPTAQNHLGENIMLADFHCIRFLVRAVYDALPRPANLNVWGKGETPARWLCSERGYLPHLLSSCPKALAEGRYH